MFSTMGERIIPSEIHLGSRPYSFREIHTVFTQSRYGEILKKIDRFAPFKPSGVSSQEWRKHLGADVNNLAHLPLSLGLTRQFLDHCDQPRNGWKGEIPSESQFSPEEKQLLLFTAITHDWGEAEIGDIPLPLKTKSDEDKEMLILRKQVKELLGERECDLNCEDLATQVEEVLTHKNEKLGKAFNAIENIGYVRTGLRAYRVFPTVTGELANNLETLGRRVVSIQTPKLIDYSYTYPPVDAFLHGHEANISTIITAEAECEGERRTVSDTEMEFIQQKWFGEYLEGK